MVLQTSAKLPACSLDTHRYTDIGQRITRNSIYVLYIGHMVLKILFTYRFVTLMESGRVVYLGQGIQGKMMFKGPTILKISLRILGNTCVMV